MSRDSVFGTRGGLLLAVGSWLVFSALTVGLGFTLREGGVVAGGVDLAPRIATTTLLQSAGIIAAAFFVTHLLLRKLAPGADPIVLPVVAALCSIGWVFLSAVGPDLAAAKGKPGLAGMGANHFFWTLLGLAVFVIVLVASQRGLLRGAVRLKYLMAVAYVVLIVVNGIGPLSVEREMGAKVIRLGPIDIQGIEIAKYLFMFFAAGYLAEEADWIRAGDKLRWDVLAPWAVVIGIGLLPVALLLEELGPTVLIGLAVLTLLYAGTRSVTLVGGLMAAGAAVGGASYLLGFPGVVRRRLDAFLEPFSHNEQVAQGLWSVSGGEFGGVGLTSSSAYRVPIIESDYAFAGWVEMTGFVGGALVLLLYALLCWRGLEIARWAKDPFEGRLALGLTAVLAAQVVMITAGTMAFAPLTGITVPFVSHGGISLVTNLVAVAALLSISTRVAPVPDPALDVPLRRISMGWAVLFGLLIVGLFVRTVSGVDAVAEHDFVDAKRHGRLQAALDSGAVTRAPDGTLLVDDAIATANVVKTDLPAQVRAGTVVERDGRFVVQSTCCIVMNPRKSSTGSTIVRGRIVDREGRLLAKSVAVPGTRKRARVYPYAEALFDVTGVYDPLLVATTGVETRLDDVLRGEVSGDASRGVSRLVSRRDAGDDVQLTVDAGLSQELYELLGPTGVGMGMTTTGRGGVVVLEGRSGEILAAVSRPAWDPNTWVVELDADGAAQWSSRVDPAAWEAAGYDTRDHPRTSRALDTRYPPGSTFKVVMGSAWLETGRDEDATVACRYGSPAGEHLPGCHRHPRNPSPTLTTALAESCNAWFSTSGIEMGAEALPFARSLGFGTAWNLLSGFGGRTWETLESRAWQRSAGGVTADWDARFFSQNPKKTARSAIGQDTVEATPLQMAVVASTVANGGEVVTPTLVSSLRVAPDPSRPDRLGAVWTRGDEPEPTRAFSKNTANALKEGMRAVMTEGTGSRLPALVRDEHGRVTLVARADVADDADVVEVAAKSGTADVCTDCDLDPHAWMIAFAPADARPGQPKVVVAAIVENGGSGAAGELALRALASGLGVLSGQGPEPTAIDLGGAPAPVGVSP